MHDSISINITSEFLVEIYHLKSFKTGLHIKSKVHVELTLELSSDHDQPRARGQRLRPTSLIT